MSTDKRYIQTSLVKCCKLKLMLQLRYVSSWTKHHR